MDELVERKEQFAEASRKIRDELLESIKYFFCREITSYLRSESHELVPYDDDTIKEAFFSPIEAKFFAEIFYSLKVRKNISPYIVVYKVNRFSKTYISFDCYSGFLGRKGFDENLMIEIFCQVPIDTDSGNYRVDFMFIANLPRDEKISLCVELDGHDFHERTKNQAQYDKQRDRSIQRAGHSIVHYTGSETWKDPHKIFIDVFDHLFLLAAGRLLVMGLCQENELAEFCEAF